jgi:hypothetical protein
MSNFDVNFGKKELNVSLNIGGEELKTEIVFPAGGGGECDVDLTGVAKQGDNTEATNSKILEEVQKIPNLKNIYSARFEKNDDNINTYTMILPIIAGVEGDTIIL